MPVRASLLTLVTIMILAGLATTNVQACMHVTLNVFESYDPGFGQTVGLLEVNLIRDGQFLGEEDYWGMFGQTTGEGNLSTRRASYDGVPAPAFEISVTEGFFLLEQYIYVPKQVESLILTFYARKVSGTCSIIVSALGIEPVFAPEENWKKFTVDFLQPTTLWPGYTSFNISNPQSNAATILLDNVTLLARAQENTLLIKVNFYFPDPKGNAAHNIDATASVLETSECLENMWLSKDLESDRASGRNPVSSLYLANGTYQFNFSFTSPPRDWTVSFATNSIIEVQPGKPDTYIFEVPLYYLTVSVRGAYDAQLPSYTMEIWRQTGDSLEVFDRWWPWHTDTTRARKPIRISSGNYNLTIVWYDYFGHRHVKETWFTIDSDKDMNIQVDAINVGSMFFTSFELAMLLLIFGMIIAFAIAITYVFLKRRHKLASKSEEH